MVQDAEIIEGVLAEFYGLCAIPHPSGGEAKLGAGLMEQLRGLDLYPERDEAGNILCDVPGTSGLELRGRLALQAHMDMVCVGKEDYHPAEDPIRTTIKDGYLCSDGRSSLGADCGIGLAAAMFLVKGDFPHVPLRLIFTVDEERGLAGAQKLRRDCLEGCTGLVNLDSFHFGEVLISSAGGLRQTFRKKSECFFPMLDRTFCLKLSDFEGGHSGDDIGKGRANAGQCLIWLLQALEIPYELASVHVGKTHNAIPQNGEAVIVVDGRDEEKLRETAAQFMEGFRELYPAEKKLHFEITETELPQWVLTIDERDDFLALGGLVPCGVQSMHPICPQVVGFSGSMGVLYADETRLELRSFLRAVDEEAMDTQGAFLTGAAESFGYEAEESRYPAWPGSGENRLAQLFQEQGKALGLQQTVTGVHVGLEAGIFHSMAPEKPMVSVGMDILDPHSTMERVRLGSIAPFVRLLGACLENWNADQA
jgi:dipeptidase D